MLNENKILVRMFEQTTNVTSTVHRRIKGLGSFAQRSARLPVNDKVFYKSIGRARLPCIMMVLRCWFKGVQDYPVTCIS